MIALGRNINGEFVPSVRFGLQDDPDFARAEGETDTGARYDPVHDRWVDLDGLGDVGEGAQGHEDDLVIRGGDRLDEEPVFLESSCRPEALPGRAALGS